MTEGAEDVEVSLLVNQPTSCLHDYTLTVSDMRAIEKADVLVMNGAGLEDFMGDALAASDAAVIDCSEGIELLPALGHEGHDHDTEYDPHIWMCEESALVMMNNILHGLGAVSYTHLDVYKRQELGIADYAHQSFAELSGGEQQLVLAARALAQQARLLLMDEPTSALDFGNQVRVLERVSALTLRGYTCLLYTSRCV